MEKLGVERYLAKIGMDNTASIHMFQRMGFQETSRSEVFSEITLAVTRDHEPFINYLRDHASEYTTFVY